MDTTLQANPIADARNHFPGMQSCTYLDLGGRGLLSTEVCAAIDAHLKDAMYGRIDKDRLFAITEEARNRFAELINAHPDEVTYTKNISEGLNIVASSLDWKSGDNVIVCPELSIRTIFFVAQPAALRRASALCASSQRLHAGR